MARIRSIRPEFWEDPVIGRLSRDARLTYIGLWNIADDEGRLRWNLKKIEADLYSFDQDVDIDAWLEELLDAGRIERYEVDGEEFLWIPTFKAYQKPNRPTGSKLPEPPPHGSLTEDSLSPQEALTPVVVEGEVVVEGGGEGDSGPDGPTTKDYFEALEITWNQKTPKGKAELGKWKAAVVALRDEEVLPEEVPALYQAFVDTFPDAAVTVTAVVNHVGRLKAIIRGGGIQKPSKGAQKLSAREARLREARALMESTGTMLELEGGSDES